MGIAQWPVFRSSLFRSVGYMFKAGIRSQGSVLISETGIVSYLELPMSTGDVKLANDDNEDKMSWTVDHDLKIPLEGKDGAALLLSERSYYPLDVYERVNPKKRETLMPLKQIAKTKYSEFFMRMGKDAQKAQQASVTKTLIWGSVVIMLACLIVYWIRK